MCFRLCVDGDCHIFGTQDPDTAARVLSFVMAVHNWQEATKNYAAREASGNLSVGTMVFACIAAAAAGLTAAGKTLPEGPPTPEWLVTVAVIAFFAGIGGCAVAAAKTVIDSLALPRIAEDETRWFGQALEHWRILILSGKFEE
jgi:hypothetical protein